jgi:hypothetical protein
MHTKIKLEIEEALDKIIQSHAEDALWDWMIQPDMAKQMALAAEQVFDSSMSGQKYNEEIGNN